MRRHKRTRSGFSLIEILLVVVIIAVMAYFLLPRLLGGRDPLTHKTIVAPRERAQQVVGVEYIGQLNQAIQMYRGDHDGQLPPSLTDLKAYGVTDEMLLDPVTRRPYPYDPQTGVIGKSNGPDSLGGGANLPQVGQ